MLPSAHHACREISVPGQPDATETARKLKTIHAEMRRRWPELANRYDVHFAPFVDELGKWHANPVLTTKRSARK